jgi:hypothetical protein
MFRVFGGKRRRDFSAAKTCWRRERDSNPRYGFPYSGFQDRLFQPLTHPSALHPKHMDSLPKSGWIQVASLIRTAPRPFRLRSRTISGQWPKHEVDSFFFVRFGREMMWRGRSGVRRISTTSRARKAPVTNIAAVTAIARKSTTCPFANSMLRTIQLRIMQLLVWTLELLGATSSVRRFWLLEPYCFQE